MPTGMRILALVLLWNMMAFTAASAQQAGDEPLQECEESPSCAYEERVYPHDPDHVFATARRAIHRMSPVDLDVDEEALSLKAAFRVFFFLDDLSIALHRIDAGTAVHIRSASRTAFWDAGTNRRRIKSFFDRLDSLLREDAGDVAGET